MYVIKILNSKERCWVAEWEGDPPRTLKIENAQTFKDIIEAELRILEVEETHPFKEMRYEIRLLNLNTVI